MTTATKKKTTKKSSAKKSTAAKKTKKKAPAKKTSKAAGHTNALKPNQVKVLGVLARTKSELTVKEIKTKSNVKKGYAALVTKGESSLAAQGLVKLHETQEGHGRARFCIGITAKGREALKKAK